MTVAKLPKIEALQVPDGLDWDAPVSARDKWEPVKAAATDGERSINIYDEIGDRGDGRGVTANLVRAVLRRMGPGDVTVNINSPGGDFFAGLAIYNLLREHEGEVHTNIVGVAASAASLIAMASDRIRIAKAGFIMVHNSWAIALGNRHDMRATADLLEQFDAAMTGVYVDRTGLTETEVMAFMDVETFFNGEQAIEKGFADALLESDEVQPADEPEAEAALRRIDIGLAKAGIPRSDRRAMIKSLSGGTPCATINTTPCAGDEADSAVLSSLRNLVDSINA